MGEIKKFNKWTGDEPPPPKGTKDYDDWFNASAEKFVKRVFGDNPTPDDLGPHVLGPDVCKSMVDASDDEGLKIVK